MPGADGSDRRRTIQDEGGHAALLWTARDAHGRGDRQADAGRQRGSGSGATRPRSIRSTGTAPPAGRTSCVLAADWGHPTIPAWASTSPERSNRSARQVTRFKPGDEVFGGRSGAFAEYLVVREDRAVTRKPANVTFEQAAAIPIAAVTALQALRDQAHVQAGQKVLINGASGGVGTYAVQIAKSLGADVTGVCSTRNVELVRSLGADHVVDYKKKTSPPRTSATTSSSTTSAITRRWRCETCSNRTASWSSSARPKKVRGSACSGASSKPWCCHRFVDERFVFFVARAESRRLERSRRPRARREDDIGDRPELPARARPRRRSSIWQDGTREAKSSCTSRQTRIGLRTGSPRRTSSRTCSRNRRNDRSPYRDSDSARPVAGTHCR